MIAKHCIALVLALCAALAAPAGYAAEAPSTAADPALEARVNRLTAELRCLVCQNQSLADSHAELAVDLKNQVREQLKAGRSEQQVIDYMTERYGDFVLYRPPVKPTTWLLWFGPLLLVALGIVVLVRTLRVRRQRGDTPALSEAEHRRALSLLGEAETGSSKR